MLTSLYSVLDDLLTLQLPKSLSVEGLLVAIIRGKTLMVS